jgi:predicted  nucleic acid-binding Zn-ribbon protein
MNKNGSFTPIFDLTDDLLKLIELKYNINVPEIYKFLDRTGCMGCPYGRKIEIELSLINDVQKRVKSLGKLVIEDAKTLVKKYTEQQKNVRNNREFNSISKETEYQELEIELSEKRIKEYKAKIEQKNVVIDTTKENIAKQADLLKHKSDELNDIMSDTIKEEALLLKMSNEYSELIDDHLLKAYNRIRSSVKNGLAVVSIDRGASGGSFFTIPPQRQVEIAGRKKIIIDEHSGRILIDSQLAEEEKEKMSKYFS